MAARSKAVQRPILLGIEGGGSHTVCLLADGRGNLLHRFELGPANILLLTDAQFRTRLREVRRGLAGLPATDGICIGLAGAHGEEEFSRVRRIAQPMWKGVPLHVTHDLETALSSVERIGSPAGADSRFGATVLVLSGTGSCFVGKTPDGRSARFGGWGHVIGDKGSGWEIGLRALKACTFYYDRDDRWTRLGERILRALNMNHPHDLIPWSPHAHKSEIAVLAKEVFAARTEGDPIARDILDGAASSLAKDTISCARKLVSKGTRIKLVYAGSVLLRQPGFARQVTREIRSRWPEASGTSLKRESAWGAVVLAHRVAQAPPEETTTLRSPERSRKARPLSPTEQRHPRSSRLDRMSLRSAIELMLDEDAKLPAAVLAERPRLERLIRQVAKAFESGGRLFYVGAGTSGRLGILDASECPPTFRVDPELVQGVIAGGSGAVFRSVEGAEDNSAAGADAMRFRGVGKQDVVVGIAASGRTPFVHGALEWAHARGCATALVCFDPAMKKPSYVGTRIAPDIGPEILTGSTRLKSGTATKLILNLLTTLAMVRIGKVSGNLMIDLDPKNTKLRDRATRIVVELSGASYEAARDALKAAKWRVRNALDALTR